MSAQYRIPRGTFDSLPVEPKPQNLWKQSDRWHHLERTIRALAFDYRFAEIRTPLFEQADLFVRGVGEASDIVSKEMYLFSDKGGRSMALRPEGTAPVMRSVIENRLDMLEGCRKLFYIGPFFRHDRPQAGRFRQFRQFGVEAIGDPSPERDFEAIDMLLELYRRLGLSHLKVMLNSLGDGETGIRYAESLRTFLRPHLSSLSPESRVRFDKNPLRILDTKDEEEQALLTDAPAITDMLDPDSKRHFDTVCTLLTKGGIAFEVTPKLVRGLDYYNRTVFEVISDVPGGQNAIGGGGRYDGLSILLGGPPIPAVGYSTGMERILQTMERQKCFFPEPEGPEVCLILLGTVAQEACLSYLYSLRHAEISAEVCFCAKIRKGLQLAYRVRAGYAVIVGEEELRSEKAQIKNMGTEEVVYVELKNIISFFKKS
ncbi:MAG: histidine--tRNA ligase [Simkaniaceae bacterium]|nr:histidine--tRNA ligase [Simkaniaceae bacterium]